jgi:CubicO group peptidase (beta-lactamase class C family)
MHRFARALLPALAGLLFSIPVLADNTKNTEAASTPISAERLARIDGLLRQYVDENRIAGAVVLLLKDGQPVYERAVGWRDKETGSRMTTDTLFRIASQTKAITSVAILALMEEGKLMPGDPVGRFIPGFDKTTVAVMDDKGGVSIVPAKRAITIRDLLTHTAGMSYGKEPSIAALYGAKGLGYAAGDGWYTADKNEPVCQTMERLATLPFVAQPGEAWVYGYATDVLGCVVERASGIRLDEFVRTRITEPLGMKDTFFFVPPAQRARLAAVYASGPNGRIVRAPNGPTGQGHYVDGPRRNFSGGAGLISTAHDYARFLEMIRNGGELDGARILSPRAVALMTTNQIEALRFANGLGFGFGFETVDRYGASGMAAPGNFGWGGAYGSQYRVDQQADLTFVLMLQLMPNETDFREKLINLVYGSLMEPITVQ